MNATISYHWTDDLTQWIEYQSIVDFIVYRPTEMKALMAIAQQAQILQACPETELNHEQKEVLRLDIQARHNLSKRQHEVFNVYEDMVIQEISKLFQTQRIDKSPERIKIVLQQIDAIMLRRDIMGKR